MSSINTVTSIQSIERNQPVNLRSMKQNLFSLQKLAIKYNRWSLYQTLLEYEDTIRCHKEIVEKYPYDGKSTFAELLEKETKKIAHSN